VSTLPLEPGLYREVVRRALAEDLGWGDLTSSLVVPDGARAAGTIGARGRLVLAGLDVALEAFRQLDPSVAAERRREDGEICRPGETIAVVRGLAAPMLTAERTALNFLRHLSGVASVTRWCIDAGGGTLRVADTRKTLPLLRTLQQYAVRVGGGVNTRASLDEGIVVKANHARVGGGLAASVARAKAGKPGAPVHAEAATVEEAGLAVDAGADVVVFTGSLPEDLKRVLRACAGRARVVVSGQVPFESLAACAAAGADVVSIGAITDSAPAADIAFELQPE
jgi:nicotinate-nucleotide pyrophosphorylase (carboxylating)